MDWILLALLKNVARVKRSVTRDHYGKTLPGYIFMRRSNFYSTVTDFARLRG